MLNPGGQPNFPATQQEIYETEFRKRFRDKSILPMITNRDWEGRFRKTGQTIHVPVLPLIHTNVTKPGEKVKYQEPKGAEETFTIGRERYFAFKLEDEDKIFSKLDLESPLIAEGTRQMSEDVEGEFFADVPSKVHVCNQGNAAGFKSASFDLGSASEPTFLYKTNALCADSPETHRNVAPDYIVSCINALNEMPGGLDTKPFVVVPVAVANAIQTSELKRADWMGDAESALRKSVRFLGELNGANVIVDNQIPMWRASGSTPAKYLVFFGDTSAVTFAEEARVKDKLQSVEEWGEFHRSKLIYDWFVRYPERIGCGYVSIG